MARSIQKSSLVVVLTKLKWLHVSECLGIW